MLEVIHISDTHFGPTRDFEICGSPVCARNEALVAAIRDLPFIPDLVVHTGDVANDPDEGAYAIAEEVLSGLPCPVYYVTGNHDDVPMMREALTFGPRESLVAEEENRLCYRVTGLDSEIDLVFVDAKVPPEEGPHGFVPEDQMDAVLAAVSPMRPCAIFLHYPLMPIGSRWTDEHLLVTNGDVFRGRLRERCGDALRGIFSGHLHRGLQLYRDGVLQSGVSSPACEFTAGPDDEKIAFVPVAGLAFHHISFGPYETMVKQYSAPCP